MGRSKPSLDEAEVADLLAMKGEVVQNREETAELREEVEGLRKDVHVVTLKQDAMATVMNGVQEAVSALNVQLTVKSDILKSFKNTDATTSAQQITAPTADKDKTNRPTAAPEQVTQHTRPMTDELRKRLAMEQEKTWLMATQVPPNLPQINVNRRAGPPCFGNASVQDIYSGNVTPTVPVRTPHTPAFHNFQPPVVRTQWEDYYGQYENEMCTQFLKSITKGPRMDFPRFEGVNPAGWIRQCDRYFQMAGAPPEYKVGLAQMYITGPADVWLRRSGLLKKKLTWAQFCEEILHRFSPSSSYDLTERFSSLKQHTMSVVDYTHQFKDLRADVQEESSMISEQWFIKCYVNGLKSQLKYQLRPLRPTSLTEAYWIAVDLEQGATEKRKTAPFPL